MCDALVDEALLRRCLDLVWVDFGWFEFFIGDGAYACCV